MDLNCMVKSTGFGIRNLAFILLCTSHLDILRLYFHLYKWRMHYLFAILLCIFLKMRERERKKKQKKRDRERGLQCMAKLSIMLAAKETTQ